MYRRMYTNPDQLQASIKSGAESERQKASPKPMAGLGARAQREAASGLSRAGEEKEEVLYRERLKEEMLELQRQNNELRSVLSNPLGESSEVTPTYSAKGKNKGYAPGVDKGTILSIVETEAKARGIDPEVAKAVVASEGLSAFQSQIVGKNGQERSYGPFQLFIDGGLGNEYMKATGRNLQEENHLEGVTNQIRFSLDKAVELGWTPWYGAKNQGLTKWQGLNGAKALGNWS